MKSRGISITVILLIFSIFNYLKLIPMRDARAVEFVSIFATGALAGVLLGQFFNWFRKLMRDDLIR